LFTPRAIFYRHEQGLRGTHVSVAVVVQTMVPSEIAGITFTVHPVTKDPNQMIIEACWGLGELIVGGQITPDAYVVDKRDGSLIDVNVSEQKKMLVRGPNGNQEIEVVADRRTQQKLNEKQIKELSDLCINIEKHYSFPCDIEWAYAGGKFYILQSRPITTL
jgi:pyruvate,water dikinase